METILCIVASIKNAFHISWLILQWPLQYPLQHNRLTITPDKQVKVCLLEHSTQIPCQGLTTADEFKSLVSHYLHVQ